MVVHSLTSIVTSYASLPVFYSLPKGAMLETNANLEFNRRVNPCDACEDIFGDIFKRANK